MPEFPCNKVTGLQPAALFILKKRLRYECLPVNLAKIFRRPTFVEHQEIAALEMPFYIIVLDDYFYIFEDSTTR